MVRPGVLLALALFVAGPAHAINICSKGQVFAKGQDLLAAFRGQLLIVAFPRPHAKDLFQRLERLAAAHKELRVVALLPVSESPQNTQIVQASHPSLIVDRDQFETRRRIRADERDVLLFDRCGRLARTMRMGSEEQMPELHSVVRNANHFADCGWCQFSDKGDMLVVDAYIRTFSPIAKEPLQIQQRRNQIARPTPGSTRTAPIRQEQTQSKIQKMSHVDRQTATQRDERREEQMKRREEEMRRREEEMKRKEEEIKRRKEKEEIMKKEREQRKREQEREERQRAILLLEKKKEMEKKMEKKLEEEDDSDEIEIKNNEQKMVETEKGKGTEQTKKEESVDEEELAIVAEDGKTVIYPDDYDEYYGIDKGKESEGPSPSSSTTSEPFFDEKWASALPFHSANGDPQEYSYSNEDLGLMRLPEETQIGKPPVIRAAPYPMDEESVPCKAVTDDICFHQRKSGGKVSSCCTKGIYLTDICVPGKCSNTTLQACCMQRYLQARFQCCADPSQDGDTPTDMFSKCCYAQFVTDDECCPRAIASEYWNSVHEICLPNVRVDLSSVRMEISVSDGVRVLDLSESRHWDYQCKHGQNRQQFGFVP